MHVLIEAYLLAIFIIIFTDIAEMSRKCFYCQRTRNLPTFPFYNNSWREKKKKTISILIDANKDKKQHHKVHFYIGPPGQKQSITKTTFAAF